MKRCKQCGELKERYEFYKHKENLDGLRGKCKLCWTKATSKYQSENKDNYAEYSSKYYRSDKGQAHVERYRKTDKCKQVEKENSRRYKEKNPIQYKAQQFLHDNVRHKGLFKPCICSLCGAEKAIDKISGHHWSYLEKHWLDVVWCCCQCHSDIHHNKEDNILSKQ